MGHTHAPSNYNRVFIVAITLNMAFVITEAGAGWYGNSLALLADAGHNLSDVLSLLLAWGGHYFAGRPASSRRTYGLRRSSILAALANAILLLLAIGAIGWEALSRLSVPYSADGRLIIIVAGIGVLINTATALLFVRDRHTDLNIRGAYLHMAADAAVSLAVVLTGALMLLTQWSWLDSVISLVIVAVIAIGSWRLLRESLDLALDAVPESIDPGAVEHYLQGLPEVNGVHHLHIWAMSTTEVALTVHLIKADACLDDAFLQRVHAELRDHFGIGHATLQLEVGSQVKECVQENTAPDHS